MIRTRGLTKDFVVSRTETVHAVRGIDLDVAPGELVAVLGPNGAGKTTTMRMLTTLIRPTAGSAVVAGADVSTDPGTVRRNIGYVGQGNGAGHVQRAADELTVQGRVYGLDARTARRRTDELLDALDLRPLARRKVSDLSGGQRRRLDVALGLVHAPQLLFLDEPSTGLDPHTRANLWEHILRLRAEHGMTIVLTTHYLDEADTMAERVVVVDHGRVIADDTADALKRDLAGDRLVLRAGAPGAPDGRSAAAALAALVTRLPGARDVTVDGPVVEARVADAAAAVPQVVVAAASAGLTVASAQAVRPTLDDVFLALTGRSLRDEGAPAAPTDDPADATTDSTRKDAA
ncbi:ABC transporter ATP-binding protein [Cellulomonas fimi]|uniref:ABC transporter related protein n=1 Tax=Cellulomonas fimi (strain ATCC 484 / DSM 20113 / JCM 1341 / CCUG 24087 / LMG 16345 / NBRC 15513 / NCIMB 8980 / NCTC 7547 / NRS-133) TaxID=590998 RepID=F4H421_CELFA|nr:ATP-binding cassette domain-containing protein [Cellulomonas fimi]AEE45373.1 ABC transporter related protein [Cellulomonas fimi ATCC 484]NNH06873.1 ATP-binding cassette domain-containing protein [Cellulomonas fimi]VEH29155.1 Daunorubicin/doxorubicin resistance ATP-binding protein DrrA [Cellulomonas fimi]